jgi:hypothetical protein
VLVILEVSATSAAVAPMLVVSVGCTLVGPTWSAPIWAECIATYGYDYRYNPCDPNWQMVHPGESYLCTY